MAAELKEVATPEGPNICIAAPSAWSPTARPRPWCCGHEFCEACLDKMLEASVHHSNRDVTNKTLCRNCMSWSVDHILVRMEQNKSGAKIWRHCYE
jgi:hypothetical protein